MTPRKRRKYGRNWPPQRAIASGECPRLHPKVGLPHHVASRELAAGPLHDDATRLQDVGSVTDLQSLEDILFHQQHGDTLTGYAFHGAENFGDQFWGDAHGGLVEQE